MDPKLLEILKKAKAIDKAAEKYDTGAVKKSNTSGLMESMGSSPTMIDENYGQQKITDIKKNIGTETYNQSVKNSKLPPAILREDSYREEDETDMYQKPVRRNSTPKRTPINENISEPTVSVDERYLRKLIASEITKALPKIIENYFDTRLVKENVQFKAGSTIFSGTVMPMPKVKGKNNI